MTIKLISNECYSGTIQATEMDHSVISPKAKLIPLKYSNAKEITKKKFPTWAKALIPVVALVEILAAHVFAHCGNEGCHL